jgi:uncharacterized repeat protein (TIGR02543 family)
MKKITVFILFALLISLTACVSDDVDYIISFESNGGTNVASINSGELPSIIPVKDGYKFSGWFLDAEFNYPAYFNAIIDKDMTVYAKWVLDEVQLTTDDIVSIIENYPFESLDLLNLDAIYIIELYENYIYDMLKEVQASVLMIDVYEDSEYSGSGSGVIIDQVGSTYYVLTNSHVVDGSLDLEFEFTLFNDTNDIIILNRNIELLWKDIENDLALMSFISQDRFVPIEFAEMSDIRVGETVYAIGSPLDLPNTITSGIVSMVDRPMEDTDGMDTLMIQHTAGINPGNSGGALIDVYGRLVGINTMSYVDEYVGEGINSLYFSVQIDIIKDIIESYE